MLGARNQHVQRARRLVTSRRARAADGAFVIEGPVLVGDALDAGVALQAVLHEPGAPAPLLARAAGAGALVLEVRPGVLDGIGDVATSQGVLAVATIPAQAIGRAGVDDLRDLDDLDDAAPLFVLAGVADPGNAGTLLRVAEAAGIGGVILTLSSVDPWSPKVVRASAGSVFRVPVLDVAVEAGAVLDHLRGAGRRCLGTRGRDAPAHTAVELPPDVVIVLGNETHGLDDAVAHVDGWIRIPMAGRVESLNVAMAGTVLAFELARRRGEPIRDVPEGETRIP